MFVVFAIEKNHKAPKLCRNYIDSRESFIGDHIPGLYRGDLIADLAQKLSRAGDIVRCNEVISPACGSVAPLVELALFRPGPFLWPAHP